MVTGNKSRRGHFHARLFGSVGLLAASLLLHACSENVSPDTSTGNTPPFLRGDGPGVSFAGADQSVIRGFAVSDLRYLHDPRLGDEEGVHYSAMLAHANGPTELAQATANGTSLSYQYGTFRDGYSLNGSVPGGTVNWTISAKDGTFLPACTLNIPERPRIVSPEPYANVSISRGLNIGIDSRVESGDAVVMIVYDSYRDEEYGDNDDPIDGPSIRTRYFTVDDDGNLEISRDQLAGMSPNRIYNLIVYRWRYETFERSDKERVGITAAVQYAIPVMFTE